MQQQKDYVHQFFSLYFLNADTRALSLDLGGTAGCLFRFLSQLLVVIRLTQIYFSPTAIDISCVLRERGKH